MSSEKKPQPVALRYQFEPGLTWHVVEYMDQLPDASKFSELVIEHLYSEATIEALRAERDEARKDAHHWKANYEGLLSVADSRTRALLSDGGQ